MEILYKHSAGGLIFKDDKVLLIHWAEPRSSYDIPKGTIEKGETPEQACIREVQEETGYKTKIITPIGQTHYEYDWTDGTHHKKTVDYYLLELDGDQPDAAPHPEEYEHFENLWLDPKEALQMLTRDIDKEILQKALALRAVS